VPLVFYQGERSWPYSREFADLFAESVREWPGVPRFSHGLIDQSGIESFQDALQCQAPHVRGDLMTYAQELLEEGRMRNQVEVIEGLLREGVEWAVIERATGVNETQFQALKQQIANMNE